MLARDIYTAATRVNTGGMSCSSPGTAMVE
jgi:hypothetical protein